MAICPKCGQSVKNGTVYCNKCGAPLLSAGSAQSSSAPAQAPSAAGRAASGADGLHPTAHPAKGWVIVRDPEHPGLLRKKKKFNPLVPAIAGGCGALLLLAGVLLLLPKSSSDTDPEASHSPSLTVSPFTREIADPDETRGPLPETENGASVGTSSSGVETDPYVPVDSDKPENPPTPNTGLPTEPSETELPETSAPPDNPEVTEPSQDLPDPPDVTDPGQDLPEPPDVTDPDQDLPEPPDVTDPNQDPTDPPDLTPDESRENDPDHMGQDPEETAIVSVVACPTFIGTLRKDGSFHATDPDIVFEGGNGRRILSVAAGSEWITALYEDGCTESLNLFGKEPQITEAQEASPDPTRADSLAVGDSNWYVLNQDGTVSCFGEREDYAELIRDWENIKQISAAGDVLVGVDEDGNVRIHDPMKRYDEVPGWQDITKVVCGRNLIIGIKSNGELVYEEDKDKEYLWIDLFRERPPKNYINVVSVAIADQDEDRCMIFLLHKDGTLSCIDDGTGTLEEIKGWTGIQQICVGMKDSCYYVVGVTETGEVKVAWANPPFQFGSQDS